MSRKEENERLFKISLHIFKLSNRTRKSLEMAGIKTVGEAVACSERQFLQLKGVGRASLYEVKEILTELGLAFGMPM